MRNTRIPEPIHLPSDFRSGGPAIGAVRGALEQGQVWRTAGLCRRPRARGQHQVEEAFEYDPCLDRIDLRRSCWNLGATQHPAREPVHGHADGQLGARHIRRETRSRPDRSHRASLLQQDHPALAFLAGHGRGERDRCPLRSVRIPPRPHLGGQCARPRRGAHAEAGRRQGRVALRSAKIREHDRRPECRDQIHAQQDPPHREDHPRARILRGREPPRRSNFGRQQDYL